MKAALYVGSFDPPTFGHLNIIERAANMFDTLYVAIAINQGKKPLLPIDERVQLLKELTAKWSNVKITSYSGLTVKYAKEQNISYLIRSIRNSEDASIELDLARSNYQLAQIETLLLPGDEKFAFIRSSIVREIALNKGDLSHFVPKIVAIKLSHLANK